MSPPWAGIFSTADSTTAPASATINAVSIRMMSPHTAG